VPAVYTQLPRNKTTFLGLLPGGRSRQASLAVDQTASVLGTIQAVTSAVAAVQAAPGITCTAAAPVAPGCPMALRAAEQAACALGGAFIQLRQAKHLLSVRGGLAPLRIHKAVPLYHRLPVCAIRYMAYNKTHGCL
jgi:hypothetical protein